MRRKLIILVAIILLASFAAAEEGCFLYSEHPSYCQSIEKSLVSVDCAEEENCNIDSMFKSNQECSTFPECSIILCSSSCLTTFQGSCSGKAVVEGDTSCSTGCCSIEASCETVSSKAECSIDATNKGASEFSFIAGACGVTCPIGVAKENIIGAKIIPEEKSESSFGIGWIFVIVMFIIIILFVFTHLNRKDGQETSLEGLHLTTSKFISRFIPTKESEESLARKKTQYELQRSHRQREQELRSFGIGPEFGVEATHENLKKMIRIHSRKKDWKKRAHSIYDLDLVLGKTEQEKVVKFDKKLFDRLDRIGKRRKK